MEEYRKMIKNTLLALLDDNIIRYVKGEKVLSTYSFVVKWEKHNAVELDNFIHQELYCRSLVYGSFDEMLDEHFDNFMEKLEWAAELPILQSLN